MSCDKNTEDLKEGVRDLREDTKEEGNGVKPIIVITVKHPDGTEETHEFDYFFGAGIAKKDQTDMQPNKRVATFMQCGKCSMEDELATLYAVARNTDPLVLMYLLRNEYEVSSCKGRREED